VHGEATVLEDAPAVRDAGVPHGVHEDPAGPQHPTDLCDQRTDLPRRQGHAQQHAREDRVDAVVGQRQRRAGQA
jgi:hypothetical protein